MKILHYFLGFPPVRNGGLTKYALDLAFGEQEQGNEVAFLVPGKKYLFKEKVNIDEKNTYSGIVSYEIKLKSFIKYIKRQFSTKKYKSL